MHQPPSRPVPPPREPARRPARVEPVPGTGYGLAIFGSPPATSGPAVGALVAGAASILVSFVVTCLGLSAAAASASGDASGWALVGGAFAVLAGFLGVAAIGLGLVGLRQSPRPVPAAAGQIRGRGLAIAGISCGGAGIAIAACSIGVAILAAIS